MISYKRENMINKTPLESIKIGGYPSILMRAFMENRVFSDYAKETVFGECEDAFERCIDGDEPNGLWQGEYWGKWVISAARASKYYGDESMKEYLHDAALRLLKHQREDGYIGTYKNSEQVTVLDGCIWNWNIWCRKYTLWGLLECYELSGDRVILDACVKFADQLIFEIKKSGKRLCETGTFCGVASCSILKPMLILYRIAEDKKYLDFCLDFVADWENAELIPGLIVNSLSGKAMSEWYDFDKKAWAKAYEMMSCFDGLLELYRVTAEEKYLTATESFYDILMKYEANPLYSVAFNDCFRDASSNVNAITEPCDVIHWMRLCHELFSLTGEAKYMDSLELAFYNPFLASSFKNGKWGPRAARGHGKHFVVSKQAKMQYNHCCVNNMPRGYMNMAESQIMSSDTALYINLYTEAEASVYIGDSRADVKITGDYLADSKAKIFIDFTGRPCAVKLRIPKWSENSVVRIDGEVFDAESGYFTVIPKKKQCAIEIVFDNSVVITYIPTTAEKTTDQWKIEKFFGKWMDNPNLEDMFLYEGRCVLRKGAVLLCRSKLCGSTKEEMFNTDLLIDESYECKLSRTTPSDGINLQFDATFTNGIKEFSATVCDYASGTNMIFDDMYSFSIYF